MREYLCLSCNMSFPSNAAFETHKAGGHKTKGKLLVTPDVPPEIAPTAEFMETVARIEANKEKVEGSDSVPGPPPESIILPIKLTYVFKGNCPIHNIPVDTFELDAAGKHFAISVCPKDKQQLSTLEVVKLN